MADTDASSPILRYNFVLNRIEFFNGSDYYAASSGAATPTVQSYTPTIIGLGTPSQSSFFYKTDGVSVDVWGSCQAGTTTGTTFTLTVPVAINGTHMPTIATAVGAPIVGEGTGGFGAVSLFYDGSDTAHVYWNRQVDNITGSQIVKNTGSDLASSTDYVSFHFSYPIA